MAQDTDRELTDEEKALQTKIGIAEKQALLAQRELANLVAQKALRDALANKPDKTDAEKEAERAAEALEAQKKDAEARKATAEAESAIFAQQKAAADARKSALEAETAAVAARFGSVTGNSKQDGTVTLKTGAGSGEAALLAAASIKEAVTKIVEDIGSRPSENNRYIIFAGTQRPTFGNWRAFKIERNSVELSFTSASFQSHQALEAARTVDSPDDATPPIAGTESVSSFVTGAGALLDVVTGLGSYFQSNYELGAVTIEGIDDDFFAVVVAGHLEGAIYPARSAKPFGNDEPISDLLKNVMNSNSESIIQTMDLTRQRSRISKLAENETNADRKDQLDSIINALSGAISAHDAARKSLNDFIARFVKNDDKGVSFASKVIDEKFIADALENGDCALFLRVNSTPAAYYTKKNLWTFFGGMPYQVMGGVIVSYMTVDGASGEIIKSGQQAIHGGYKKISQVQKEVQEAMN